MTMGALFDLFISLWQRQKRTWGRLGVGADERRGKRKVGNNLLTEQTPLPLLCEILISSLEM
jgi:hypothetical protein